MTEADTLRAERVRVMAGKEAEIWSALIGAYGSPNIQKFVIMPRIYLFARAMLNIEHFNPDREQMLTHRYAQNPQSQKLKLFIDFIDGEISLEQAQQHQIDAQTLAAMAA